MSWQDIATAAIIMLALVWLVLMIANASRESKELKIKLDNAFEYRRLMRAWARKNGLDEGGE